MTESKLAAVLERLPGTPRVVMGGNFGTPWRALAVLDASVSPYRLFALNAQHGVPDRDGVILESSFVGPGMRGAERLRYFPCRLSLVPELLGEALPPDVVLVQTSAPVGGTVSLGIEVNILPAAIEAALARGGLVVAQVNPHMPFTYGDAVLPEDYVDRRPRIRVRICSGPVTGRRSLAVRSRPRSCSAARTCTTGSTATRGSGCCGPRRPTTRA